MLEEALPGLGLSWLSSSPMPPCKASGQMPCLWPHSQGGEGGLSLVPPWAVGPWGREASPPKACSRWCTQQALSKCLWS